ncbi:MAG: LytTR family DNA-binding domain-containing protein [Peptostreptococcaceae bacterium]|nr:LytTR family DNA-binding domain-containing protein [Peptostreptococcaceae bacterium]
MFRIAICDDHMNVCSEIEKVILQMEKNISEALDVEVFYSGESLLKSIQNEGAFDVIFLDIELGKINGVEVGHILRDGLEDYNTKIIYISSKNTYDRQLFEVQPFLFLAKPLSEAQIVQSMERLIKMLNKENKSFSFKMSGQNIKIPFKEILYFEGMGREVRLVTGKEEYRFYSQLKDIEKLLPDFFLRPHRSYIVNYEHIVFFKYEEFKMSNGEIIPISQSNRKEMRAFQMEYEQRRLQRE